MDYGVVSGTAGDYRSLDTCVRFTNAPGRRGRVGGGRAADFPRLLRPLLLSGEHVDEHLVLAQASGQRGKAGRSGVQCGLELARSGRNRGSYRIETSAWNSLRRGGQLPAWCPWPDSRRRMLHVLAAVCLRGFGTLPTEAGIQGALDIL